MQCVQLTKELFKTWDTFAQESHEAWFWQTTDWLVYRTELSGANFVADESFFVYEQAAPVALCPLMVERSRIDGVEYQQFSFGGDHIPCLAIVNAVPKNKRLRIMNLYMHTIQELAQKHAASYVSIKVPSLAQAFLQPELPLANPFIKFGFIDLPYQTQIIDLRRDEEYLWRDVRKGHKADIKRIEKKVAVNVWDAGTITKQKCAEYQSLHTKAAGGATRSQKTFDLMFEWIRNGKAILIEAVYQTNAVGFTLIITYKKGAYYGSVCKDPEYTALPISHLCQWRAIQYLKASGIEFYDIGIQHYPHQWFTTLSSKEVNISRFKRGFGGQTVPLLTSEYFFSTQRMRATFGQRVQQFCEHELVQENYA